MTTATTTTATSAVVATMSYSSMVLESTSTNQSYIRRSPMSTGTTSITSRKADVKRWLQDDNNEPVRPVDQAASSSPASSTEACQQETEDYFENNDVLQAAKDAYTSSMEELTNDSNIVPQEEKVIKIGFPPDAVQDYQQACEEQQSHQEEDGSEGYDWSFVESADFSCRSLQEDDETNGVVSLHIYNIGMCLPLTPNCQDIDPLDLYLWTQTTPPLWQQFGLDCRVTEETEVSVNGNDSTEEEEQGDNDDGEQAIETMTDAPSAAAAAAGGTDEADDENESTSNGNAFLSPDDAACMDATTALVEESSPDLPSALESYQQSLNMQGLGSEPSSSKGDGMTMSYSDDAAAALQAACEVANGYWSMMVQEEFVCDMMGMAEQKLTVQNYGNCLASITECQNMDLSHLLESVWNVMGLFCRPLLGDDNKEESGTNVMSPPPTSPPSSTTEENDMGGDDTDIEGPNNRPPTIDDLNLSESDSQCVQDTESLVEQNPSIKDATEAFSQTMIVDLDDPNELQLGFPDTAVANLHANCQDNTSMYFSLVELQYFSCNMEGLKTKLKVTNIANCFALTEECRALNPLRLMESVWKTMGLQCTEISQTGNNEYSGHPAATIAPSNGSTSEHHSTGDGNNNNDQEDAEVNAIGLTENDIACMHESDGFIQQSESLSDAAEQYAKHVEMNDHTKLGFPADATANMEQACQANDGLWSAIDSDDVTCLIQGHERRINVYNFGNCLVHSDHCSQMDPMVLVKAFFWEVLHLQCWAKGETGPITNHNSGPTTNSQPGGNDGSDSTGLGTSSQQQEQQQHVSGSMSSSGGGDSDDVGMPGYATAVIVLVVVVALGFFAFYKINAGGNQGVGGDRNTRREPIQQYEMTDVSELRFDSFMT